MKITKQDMDELLKTIGKTFKVLEDRERKILRLRYGLEDGIPKTLEQVAKLESVTRERIRQIEFKALEKLNLVMKYDE